MGRLLHRMLGPREMSDGEHHIASEDLARLAEGAAMGGKERDGFIRHLNRCQACYDILRETLADLPGVRERPKGSRRPLYVLAASIVLCALIGGGLFLKYFPGPGPVVTASLVLDPGLKKILQEDASVRWSKGDRVDRLVVLLRERGIPIKGLERVELSEPYFAGKDLFGPEGILKVRIEKGVAYLKVVEENMGQPQWNGLKIPRGKD